MGSQKKRHTKKKNPQPARVESKSKEIKPLKINLGIIVFLVLFAYILIMVVSYFRSEHITPYEVKVGSLAVNNTYHGVVLRDEQVINSAYSGYINYYTRENEKMSSGSMVYTVDSTGRLSDMVNNDTGDGSTISETDLNELRNQISDFATSFTEKRYNETYDFKYKLEGTVLKFANSNVLANIDKLREENYSDSIDFGYAPNSGVVIYSNDGYEELTAETITPDQVEGKDYTKKQFHSNDLIAEGDPAYKLITSEDWTILIEIDEDKATSLANESYIEVRFLKNNYTAWAAVSILRQNGRIYARLDFNNSMITFAGDRFLEIELLDHAEEGLKIPNSSIVERAFYLIPEEYLTKGGNSGESGFIRDSYNENGEQIPEFVPATLYSLKDGEYYVDESVFNIGDYLILPDSTEGEKYPISKQATLIGVYNINKGYADFKQITILNQNEEYAIVKSNTEYGLSVYDHIVLKGNSVNENDFIYELKKDNSVNTENGEVDIDDVKSKNEELLNNGDSATDESIDISVDNLTTEFGDGIDTDDETDNPAIDDNTDQLDINIEEGEPE